MPEAMVRDWRWLVVAVICFSGFAGLWTSQRRLENMIAFGQPATDIHQRLGSLKLHRWLSLIAMAVAGAMFFLGRPFNTLVWVGVAGWFLWGMRHIVTSSDSSE